MPRSKGAQIALYTLKYIGKCLFWLLVIFYGFVRALATPPRRRR